MSYLKVGQLFVQKSLKIPFFCQREEEKGWPAATAQKSELSKDNFFALIFFCSLSKHQKIQNAKISKTTQDTRMDHKLILISRKILDYNSDRIVENSTFASTRKSC